MIVNLHALICTAALFSASTLVCALSPLDIPSNTPIASLLSSANAHLAKGEIQDALTYYDIAITRDPEDYLTHFRRGAAYLSIGRTKHATQDFDKVLAIQPKHEQALLQRAKIKARHGEWEAAKEDYTARGNSAQELKELAEAQGAASLAAAAEKNGNWEECITQSGAGILVAAMSLSLRKTRAHCRLELGMVEEAMGDLKYALQIQPGLTEPHLQISAITFYALGDLERGLDQMRQCLHSDPDSKSCKKLYRRQKVFEKQLAQLDKTFSKKQYISGMKVLHSTQGEPGLLQAIKDEVEELKATGTIPAHAPNNLVLKLMEMVCEAYYEAKNYKKATPACSELLSMNQNSLHGLLNKAHTQRGAEDFEAAMETLKRAKEHHPEAQQISQLMHAVQIEIKRSKSKDYYKLLGLQRDADEVQIKAAYRKMVKIHHPDKAHKQGISKEEAEKKMAAINEAYEVLSDPELRARYDQGDDPNDHEQQRRTPFQGSPFGGGGGGGGPMFGQQSFNFKFTGGGFQFG